MNAIDPEVTGRKFLTTRHLCQRYGKTRKTIDRWLNNPELGFPKPLIINGRRLFDETQLQEWERRTAGSRT